MKEEIIDLDFEYEKMVAHFNEKLKDLDEKDITNFHEDQERNFDLNFLEDYMNLSEDFFEEIYDIVNNAVDYPAEKQIQTIKEILESRVTFLDALVHPRLESEDRFCL